MRKVTIEEIPELRAYNATRDELRRSIIALKSRRRVALGPLVTVVFENTETVRWQITEMMRVERIATDAAIAHEVEVYNKLVPDRGELSCTMFIELTSEESMREWLPKLVGIQRSVSIVCSDGSVVAGFDPEERRLTRDEVTASVHYLKFAFPDALAASIANGATAIVALDCAHPSYVHRVELDADVRAELTCDLAEP